ncbi:hypothetical protein ASE01_17330 [Nocardioides sp. Root190]|uniref:hypothetical protein n=1 Tax=Nocardioides sp. Root190 TaxID=1736488 RepID=UPI0006F22022|nr:hypothetical protein [Nocardioides sp. Root190]KRB75121.1 hypothetical protein ASE01_17330 [Nocardioides sp. Root190]
MSDFDERTVIAVGGWDGRLAVVRAVRTLGDRAAAVVDANGDGADINLEHFRREAGVWQLCSSGGGAGDWGRGWYDGVWAEHDRDENGWWLTLEPGPAPDDSPGDLPGGNGDWWAYVPGN